MKIFNYKPKSDIKTMLKTFWPIPFAAIIAIWQILSPSGIRLFRIIRIQYPMSTILIVAICAAVIIYQVCFKMPRIKKDKEHSKPINFNDGIVTCTQTKNGMPKEITFKVSDIKNIDVDEDDSEFSFTIDDNSLTFYADYFDTKAEYEEFKKLLGIAEK